MPIFSYILEHCGCNLCVLFCFSQTTLYSCHRDSWHSDNHLSKDCTGDSSQCSSLPLDNGWCKVQRVRSGDCVVHRKEPPLSIQRLRNLLSINLHFFLLGSLVYETPVEIEENLLARFLASYNEVQQNQKVQQNFMHYCNACIGSSGRHFEQLLWSISCLWASKI